MMEFRIIFKDWMSHFNSIILLLKKYHKNNNDVNKKTNALHGYLLIGYASRYTFISFYMPHVVNYF